MEQPDANNVLAVSHGGAIHSFVLKWARDHTIHIPNCSAMKFSYDNGVFKYEETIEAD